MTNEVKGYCYNLFLKDVSGFFEREEYYVQGFVILSENESIEEYFQAKYGSNADILEKDVKEIRIGLSFEFIEKLNKKSFDNQSQTELLETFFKTFDRLKEKNI